MSDTKQTDRRRFLKGAALAGQAWSRPPRS